MMEFIREYLLRIVAAGLISAAALRLLEGKGTAFAVGRILAGLLVAFTVISPLADVRLGSFDGQWTDWQQNAQAAVTAGEQEANNALRQGIKQRTEAYIWDKAKKLEANLAVEVTLSDDTIPVPIAVRLSGNISPYAKKQLQDILERELDIPKEAQQWT